MNLSIKHFEKHLKGWKKIYEVYSNKYMMSSEAGMLCTYQKNCVEVSFYKDGTVFFGVIDRVEYENFHSFWFKKTGLSFDLFKELYKSYKVTPKHKNSPYHFNTCKL